MEPQVIISIIILILLAGYVLYLVSSSNSTEYPSPEKVAKSAPSQQKLLNDGHILSFLQYEPAVLPMTYSDGLYWVDLVLQDQYATAGNSTGNQPATYRLIADSASDVILVPSPNCTDCQGPRWMVQSGAQERQLKFQGGQEVYYQYATAYSPSLRQNIQIGVMGNGSNYDHGPTLNIFGLMNPALQLHYLTLDFRRSQIIFEASPSVPINTASIAWSPLQRLPYWALPVAGVPGVDWIILDTGTEYVVVDESLNLSQGFTFLVGSTTIKVPGNVIRKKKALVPRSIVLGNIVMRNHNWLLDFLRMRVAIV